MGIRISEMEEATTFTADDYVPIVTNGTNKKALGAKIKDFIAGFFATKTGDNISDKATFRSAIEISATNTPFDKTGTGMSAENVQAAIAELSGNRALIDGSNITNPSAFRSAIGISNIFTTKDLLTVSNVPTTATSYNLIESFNNYLLIMLSILFYDNVRGELIVTANYFNNTSAGLRPTVSYSPANLAIDVYKNGNNAVYVKAYTSQSNYKLVITGICKIN